ncbi:putative leucine-rich repeat receptor-like serine/threonine-protein kinase At2g24130 isoform X2 [Cryptomeria japonica]|nr:putative leucine-rich repeat receptor-like serine/threonine-protein kinase At2g24130 isoform X2 [Cryptomeria japonica]XP_059070889.1 putative leucine-rich repeat receptor-like serine/threonine-protein kinase At2g24130 isoform X2 [Cryptomeria japonica]
MSLEGPISPFLGNLSFLRVLYLWNNSFEGQIPSQLGRLFRLRKLNLSKNKIEGFIPPTLGDCRSLQFLSLSFNNLSGKIPPELGLLSHLETLWLDVNPLITTIPSFIGNLTSLISLDMAQTGIHGSIPVELGMLTQLRLLSLNTNNLTGMIPTTLSNCTLIQILALYDNPLSGHIPWQFGKLSELQLLYLWGNNLTGKIPSSLFNCTQLQEVELATNELSGMVPMEFGKLLQLEWLDLARNHLVSEISGLSFLIALINCSNLESLDLSTNYLTGILPPSISQLSSQISYLALDSNKIEGIIPSGIGNLTKLTMLNLSSNYFSGTIPSTLSKLSNLETLYLDKNNLYGRIPKSLGYAKRLGLLSLSGNMISGKIPESLGDLPQLRYLVLHHNQLSGKIPASLGRCITLEKLDLAHNKLEGNLPHGWASFPNLQFYFNISSNFLQGSLLEVSKMVMVQAIDVSHNNFSGEILAPLSNCIELQYLNLSWNSFDGAIPASLKKLKNLQDIDLSNNNLSGAIPMDLQEMIMLQHINLSSNKLIGEVPKGGAFGVVDESAFLGNVGLCGSWIKLPSCSSSKHKQGSISKKVILPIVIGTTIFIMSFILVIFYMRHKKENTLELNIGPRIISFDELVDATGGFDQTNLLGVGSFGSVYRGILNDGTNIAVKVLNLEDENVLQSFNRECNVLKRVRHRNVIKIISTCSTSDFKALILPFMSNGSLERLLYPEGGDECRLKLNDRLRIAKEIAQGMEYLHHHCFVQVIHCDLKPNNVLLGDDVTPCIADFGIAKIIFGNSIDSLTFTSSLKGSIGYIAPEYGMGGNISTKGDVYSYGILLLELLTRRRPTDDIFVEGITLSKWASMNFPSRLTEVVDKNLLINVKENDIPLVLECLAQSIQVGLICTRELPQQCPNMMEVVKRLEKISSSFLGTPRDFQFPIDISPFLESTSGPKNTTGDSSSTS